MTDLYLSESGTRSSPLVSTVYVAVDVRDRPKEIPFSGRVVPVQGFPYSDAYLKLQVPYDLTRRHKSQCLAQTSLVLLLYPRDGGPGHERRPCLFPDHSTILSPPMTSPRWTHPSALRSPLPVPGPRETKASVGRGHRGVRVDVYLKL